MTDHSEYAPVRVHVVSMPAQTRPKRKSRRKSVQLRTIVLTAANPAQNIMGVGVHRTHALIQATGNDVVISASEAQAQDPYNEATGLPNPDGYLLSHANTAPTPFPVTEALWASAAAYPALVTVALFSEAEG